MDRGAVLMPPRRWTPVLLAAAPPPGCPVALTLSAHAVERYQERWRPTWAHADAARELTDEVRRAVYVERDGQAYIYRTPRGALLTVAGGTVATVLPPGAEKTLLRPVKRATRGKNHPRSKASARVRARQARRTDRAAAEALAWNVAHQVGAAVIVTLGDGSEVATTTRSHAWVQCDHASVLVEGYASAWDLTRVRPAPAGEELRDAATEKRTA